MTPLIERSQSGSSIWGINERSVNLFSWLWISQSSWIEIDYIPLRKNPQNSIYRYKMLIFKKWKSTIHTLLREWHSHLLNCATRVTSVLCHREASGHLTEGERNSEGLASTWATVPHITSITHITQITSITEVGFIIVKVSKKFSKKFSKKYSKSTQHFDYGKKWFKFGSSILKILGDTFFCNAAN